jgi:hypothetical protein
VDPAKPLVLSPLASLRSLLAEALDCVDVARWPEHSTSATFISSQLRLLHSILDEARNTLHGAGVCATDTPPDASGGAWIASLVDPGCFVPRLPEDLVLAIEVEDASLILTFRTLEDAKKEMDFGTKLAFAIGAQRRLEHDEMEDVFCLPRPSGGVPMDRSVDSSGSGGGNERQFRVLEKVRVDSADPSLMSAMAKVGVLEREVGLARSGLAAVMGESMDDT